MMRAMFCVMLGLLACGGDKDDSADDSGDGTPATTTDTGPCLGTVSGTISIGGPVDCSEGCAGQLLIGWFAEDPTVAPTLEPLRGYVGGGVDLATGPADYAIDDVPCGEGFLSTLLDIDFDFGAGDGDLVPMPGSVRELVRDGDTTVVDQALNFRLKE
ncbi:MAG: hypothetical protein ACI8PZ_005100 [Myxococcota bacterium]|jgi:hypothetical protein